MESWIFCHNNPAKTGRNGTDETLKTDFRLELHQSGSEGKLLNPYVNESFPRFFEELIQ